MSTYVHNLLRGIKPGATLESIALERDVQRTRCAEILIALEREIAIREELGRLLGQSLEHRDPGTTEAIRADWRGLMNAALGHDPRAAIAKATAP